MAARPLEKAILWSAGTLADVPDVAALAQRAFDPEFQECWSARQMADVLALPGSWLELGRDQEAAVRAFALSRAVADSVELLLCAVDPGWRRAGLGLRLLERVAWAARCRGGRRLFLEVRESNRAARALYERAGFRPAGRRPGYYRSTAGVTVDAITLVLDIGDSSPNVLPDVSTSST